MRIPLWIVWLTCVVASRAEAQQSGAISLQFDPSVRDSGMGGACAANFWTGGESSWCNPALLGSVRGIGYDYTSTQLVPDLADDIFFRAERFRIGGGGLGFSFSGEPHDRLGFARLEYGTSAAVTGRYDSFEDIDTWAVGVNAVEAIEGLLHTAGIATPGWARSIEVSCGYAAKKVHVVLAPSGLFPPSVGSEASAEVRDRGLLVRVTPYESGRRFLRAGENTPGALRFDVAYGIGIHNQPDEVLTFDPAEQGDPIGRFTHQAVALRASQGVTAHVHDALRQVHLGWMVGERTELWSAALALGREVESYPASGDDRVEVEPVDRFGLELELLDHVAFRYGYVEDERGQVMDDSFGLSVGLQFRGCAGVRYDFASIPQYVDLTRPKRHAVVAFVDGLELARILRE